MQVCIFKAGHLCLWQIEFLLMNWRVIAKSKNHGRPSGSNAEPKSKLAWRKKIKGGGVIMICIVLIIVIAVVIFVATNKYKKNSSYNAIVGFNKDFNITWAKNHTRVSNHTKNVSSFTLNLVCNLSNPRSVLIRWTKNWFLARSWWWKSTTNSLSFSLASSDSIPSLYLEVRPVHQ